MFGSADGEADTHCGIRYYVRAAKKPKDRAAVSLVVKAGSVLEEEAERGVAHIVEHLAFSATEVCLISRSAHTAV